jgi:hypothetical protein
MTARECTRAIADIRSARQPGLRSWLAGAADAVHVEAIVVAMHVAALWASLRHALSAWRSGGAQQQRLRAEERVGKGAEEEEEEDSGLPPLQQLPAEFVAATTGSGAPAA